MVAGVRTGQSQPHSQGWGWHHQIQLCSFSAGLTEEQSAPDQAPVQKNMLLVYFNCF